MIRVIAPLALALALAACGAGEKRSTTEGWAWVPLHPRTHEPAIAALVLSHGMSGPGAPEGELHPLAVAVWADGTLISSAASGGAYGQPYRTANLGTEASENLRSHIQRVMVACEGQLVSYGIVDAASEIVLVREGERVWRMESCIDLFESNPKLIAFAGGVAARDQRPPLDAEDPAERELQEFRDAWASAKQALLSAVPEASTELEARPLEFSALGSRR